MAHDQSNVQICIITFRRPTQLRRLVAALGTSSVPGCTVGVVVVDNDPDGSARPVIEQYGRVGTVNVTYGQSGGGIASARNRCLEIASPADFFAFIDDDETPEPGWLAELVRVQRDTGCDIIAGPVTSSFVTEPPRWVRTAGIFDRPRRPTGTVVSEAGAGNLLLTAYALSVLGRAFNPALDELGGEDSEMCKRAVAAGLQIVWADEAEAVEAVSPDRIRLRWILKRAFREGNTRPLIDIVSNTNARTPTWRLRWIAQGMPRVVSGLLLMAAGVLPVSGTRLVAGARRSCRGLGMIAGAIGWSYHEYRPSPVSSSAGSNDAGSIGSGLHDATAGHVAELGWASNNQATHVTTAHRIREG